MKSKLMSQTQAMLTSALLFSALFHAPPALAQSFHHERRMCVDCGIADEGTESTEAANISLTLTEGLITGNGTLSGSVTNSTSQCSTGSGASMSGSGYLCMPIFGIPACAIAGGGFSHNSSYGSAYAYDPNSGQCACSGNKYSVDDTTKSFYAGIGPAVFSTSGTAESNIPIAGFNFYAGVEVGGGVSHEDITRTSGGAPGLCETGYCDKNATIAQGGGEADLSGNATIKIGPFCAKALLTAKVCGAKRTTDDPCHPDLSASKDLFFTGFDVGLQGYNCDEDTNKNAPPGSNGGNMVGANVIYTEQHSDGEYICVDAIIKVCTKFPLQGVGDPTACAW